MDLRVVIFLTLCLPWCVSAEEIRKIAERFIFLEGPVWMPQGHLIFSDIPANKMHSFQPGQEVKTFRDPSAKANGNTVDREGRLITCEHFNRRVTRTEKDGKITVLADTFEGKKLNSPNDIVVKSDGSIWFTDPTYGLDGRPADQPGTAVFRLDPTTRNLAHVATDFEQPNGLCFSPDESKLFIADSGKQHHIRVFDVKEGKLENSRIFCVIDKGVPDGIRCSSDGRLWSSAGDGVHVFFPDGRLQKKIFVPEVVANLCLINPGDKIKTLYLTATSSLYVVEAE